MKGLNLLLICVVSALLGFSTKALLENAVIFDAVHSYGGWFALIVLAGLSILGLSILVGYFLILRKIKILLKTDEPLTEGEIAEGLIDLLTSTEGITNPTPRERQRAAFVNMGAWLMRRQATQFYFNATVTVVGGLIGAATLFLLNEQNDKIDEQNRRIILQTDANVTQSVLLEGARRASGAQELSILLSDVRKARNDNSKECNKLDEVDCWRWHNQSQEQKRRFLPKLLQQRVKAFAQRSTPYFTVTPKARIVEFDERLNKQFDLPFLSPERGQLFQELALNDFDLANIDFAYAALDAADLPGIYMRGVNLNWADLNNVTMSGASLSDANLRNADLSEANFEKVNASAARFDGATLISANFQGAFLLDSALTDANLKNIKLNLANLVGARFRNSNLEGADLRRANLTRADLRNTNLKNAFMGWANISGADFRNSEQSGLHLVTAWAWSDASPKGLDMGLQVKLCTFKNGMKRMKKPSDEVCRDVIVGQ